MAPFHLAIVVRDLAEAWQFYHDRLGFAPGRSDALWQDYDMYGHQLVCHLNPDLGPTGKVPRHCNPVDSESVPVPHFGIVLERSDWDELAERLRNTRQEFIIEPTVRFDGEPGEQATMFFEDPSGNCLEFKSMANPENLFAV